MVGMEYTCPKCKGLMIVEKVEKLGVESFVNKTTMECSNKQKCGNYKTIMFDDSEKRFRI